MYAEPLVLLVAFVLSSGLFHGHQSASLKAATLLRLETAEAVLTSFDDTKSTDALREQMKLADCISVMPAFEKDASGGGTASGRGFISCRTGDHWSPPRAISLETTASAAAPIGKEKIDIVMLSMDPRIRGKLLSERFTIGKDAPAAWEDGGPEPVDPVASVLYFGRASDALVSFNLDGAIIKSDDRSNKALYGRTKRTSDSVGVAAAEPTAVQTFSDRLTSALR